MTLPLFPLFADLAGRTVLVVGGGIVARRKVEPLLAAGARIVVGAPQLDASLAQLVDEGRIEHRAGRFDPSWLDAAWLAIAATDDMATNREVAAAGEARRVWVNVVDDAELSSFHIPARVERGPLQVAISSSGGAPMLARHLREMLETQLDESLGALAALLGRQRQRIRARLPDLQARRRFFEQLLAGPVQGLLRRGDADAARRELSRTLDRAASDRNAGSDRVGRVALVGAGPGDPGLLTLRGLRLLNEADVILHDRLVSPEVLALARRDAQLIDVGKQVGGAASVEADRVGARLAGPRQATPSAAPAHHTEQDRINALLLLHARAGQRVVRLKGGDPLVFGRGGEELEVLRTAGISYEVVPGITAALACAAYAGIPLTHRDHAQSVQLLTAHCKDSADTPDGGALAAGNQTLVVYMGVAALAQLSARLIAHGTPPTTPFALVENGSRPEQRVLVGTLAGLADLARLHAVQSPALLILGGVAALAENLHWFGAAPIRELRQAALAEAA